LIVTEGTKTEPNYLNEIRIERRVPNAHIAVVPAEGRQPLKVVEHAERYLAESAEFERVFAVFDRDSHPLDSYQNALKKAAALNGKLKNSEGQKVAFRAIPSVPCFELWLLIHFQDEQAFHERGAVYKKLQKHLPKYCKGAKGIYAATASMVATATKRACNLRKQYKAFSGTQPFTEMDILVEMLRDVSGDEVGR
jgi:hypothetical protein